MRLPVRTVCVACLHSLEVSSSDDFTAQAVCPYCGNSIDLRRSGSETLLGDGFASPPPVDSEIFTPKIDAIAGKIPDRIGRFVLREPLGEGGYGKVFRAYDPHLERDVALKILKPNRLGKKALERFYREARAAARLDHPNIVALHDAGRDGDRCWIAYQLVPGQTLSMLRDVDRPSLDATVRIIRDLALALDHAHGRGVFHRDLKPANVLIDDTGRARLTDFGLARRGDLESDLTQEGTVLGTPQYMSPEAAAGKVHESDGRSDLYSLGVILYELICGKRPSEMPTNTPLWRVKRFALPPTPHSIDRSIPLELDQICMKVLAFDPDSRYPDARSFANVLTHYLQGRSEGRTNFQSTGKNRLAFGVFVIFSILSITLGISLERVIPSGTNVMRSVAHFGPGRMVAGSLPTIAKPEPEIPVKVSVPDPPTMVVLNTETKKFHTLTCRFALKLAANHRSEIPFPDEATIAAKFLKPCEICKPTREKALKVVAPTH